MRGRSRHARQVGVNLMKNPVLQSQRFQQRKGLAGPGQVGLFVPPLPPLALRLGVRGDAAASASAQAFALG